jgi:hypothetical protein
MCSRKESSSCLLQDTRHAVAITYDMSSLGINVQSEINTTLCDKVCQQLATGRKFPPPIKLTGTI